MMDVSLAAAWLATPDREYPQPVFLLKVCFIINYVIIGGSVAMGNHDPEARPVNLFEYRVNDIREEPVRDPVGASNELHWLRGGLLEDIHAIVLEIIDIFSAVRAEEQRGKNDPTNPLSQFDKETLALKMVTSKWKVGAMPF